MLLLYLLLLFLLLKVPLPIPFWSARYRRVNEDKSVWGLRHGAQRRLRSVGSNERQPGRHEDVCRVLCSFTSHKFRPIGRSLRFEQPDWPQCQVPDHFGMSTILSTIVVVVVVAVVETSLPISLLIRWVPLCPIKKNRQAFFFLSFFFFPLRMARSPASDPSGLVKDNQDVTKAGTASCALRS